jgi:hypothetical protein
MAGIWQVGYGVLREAGLVAASVDAFSKSSPLPTISNRPRAKLSDIFPGSRKEPEALEPGIFLRRRCLGVRRHDAAFPHQYETCLTFLEIKTPPEKLLL